MRRGDWIQTYTGRQFWPLDPWVEDVALEDIAHALSMICRFNGHCRYFYSVAEHSVLVSQAVRDGSSQTTSAVLSALLHDAAEAYLLDIPSPVKNFLPGYREAEGVVQKVIFQAFNLSVAWNTYKEIIKDIDHRIVVDEISQVMATPRVKWSRQDEKPVGVKLLGLVPAEAEALFLAIFRNALSNTAI